MCKSQLIRMLYERILNFGSITEELLNYLSKEEHR
jgi:hypothetical protein